MNARFVLTGTTIFGLLLPGCTTTLKVARAPVSNAPLEGINYALPSLSYNFIISHQLIACDGDQPRFKTDVTVSSTYAPGETYNINYESMSKFWKTSSFDLQNYEEDKEKGIPAGIIKSINLENEDKSIAIVESVAKIGISIARMAALGAGANLAAGPKCPTERLGDLSDHKDALITLTKSLEDELAKRKPYEYALDLGVIPQKDRATIENILSSTADLERQIAKHQKAIVEITKKFTFVETQVWRPEVNVEFLLPRDGLPSLQTSRLPFFENGIESARMSRQKEWLSETFGADVEPESAFGKELAKLGIVLALEPLFGWSDKAVGTAGSTAIARTGVYYRDRASARLTMCRPTSSYRPDKPIPPEMNMRPNESASDFAARKKLADDNYRKLLERSKLPGWTKDEAAKCQVNPTPLLVDEIRNVPQAGRLMVLPFTNGFGEKSTLKAAFSPSGMLTSFNYGRVGAGEKAATAASGLVTEIGSLKKDLDTAKKAKETAESAAKSDSIESIEAEIKLQKAKQELTKLTMVPPDVTGLVTPKMVDQAKLDYDLAKAQADLAELRAKVAATEKKP